jgi:hypothetical protein
MDNNSSFFNQNNQFIPVESAGLQQSNISLVSQLQQNSQYLIPENIINKKDSISLMMIPEQNDTRKYYQNSITDMKSKVHELKNLQTSTAYKPQNTANQPANNTTTQISNHVNNTTTVIHDYVKAIKGDYQKLPDWRSLGG